MYMNKSACKTCERAVTDYNRLKERLATEKLVTREIWKQLCNKHDSWCDYTEVAGMDVSQAEEYIKRMPTLGPLD